MFFKRFLRNRPTADADFVSAYKATGDLDVLGELYERHMDLVYAVCFKYLRDEAESKDAVMQLFEQLVVDLRRHEVTNFKSWLHSVARNHCLMHLRKQRIRVGDGDTDLLDEERPLSDTLVVWPDGDDDALDVERHLARLPAALNQLPEPQRVCIDLFYLQQKSYAEVADLTGFDLKQVKSYLQNGRRNLKISLQK
ncbi:sigma-70 family RNA polymerase sigma factor [Fibrella sp. HMF5335]|uniref:Sigma-70 family RNA polymerase sigma factor n=1 Tax=Fibrella rubiginis TaxID=2817060 RepID=A0A939GCC6_9BACT|nr:sigma-70 family RNA polymerase sigma factor [Fibrella rubiginis]MBO0935188.1 sigma-70 family RNA polymerase sigma factor [Fibrella rubiginis]